MDGQSSIFKRDSIVDNFAGNQEYVCQAKNIDNDIELQEQFQLIAAGQGRRVFSIHAAFGCDVSYGSSKQSDYRSKEEHIHSRISSDT